MSRKKITPGPEPSEAPPSQMPLRAMVNLRSPPLLPRMRTDVESCLRRVRDGECLVPPLSKPMRGMGHNVHELRLSDESGDWRFIYAIRKDHVLLIDQFKKTTEQTLDQDRDRSKDRLRAYDAEIAAREAARRKAEKRQGSKPKDQPKGKKKRK